MTDPKLVTIVPVPGHFIQGVKAVEQQVTEKRAAELCATGAFIRKDKE